MNSGKKAVFLRYKGRWTIITALLGFAVLFSVCAKKDMLAMIGESCGMDAYALMEAPVLIYEDHDSALGDYQIKVLYSFQSSASVSALVEKHGFKNTIALDALVYANVYSRKTNSISWDTTTGADVRISSDPKTEQLLRGNALYYFKPMRLVDDSCTQGVMVIIFPEHRLLYATKWNL